MASYVPHSSWGWPVSVALPGTRPGRRVTYPIQVLVLEDTHLQALLSHLHGLHSIHQCAVKQLHQVHAEVMVLLLGRRGQLAEAGIHVAGGQAAATLLQRLQELVEPAAPAGPPLDDPQQLLRPLHLAPLQRGRPHLLPLPSAQRGKQVQHRLHPDELLQPRPEAGDQVEEALVSGFLCHGRAGGARDAGTPLLPLEDGGGHGRGEGGCLQGRPRASGAGVRLGVSEEHVPLRDSSGCRRACSALSQASAAFGFVAGSVCDCTGGPAGTGRDARRLEERARLSVAPKYLKGTL